MCCGRSEPVAVSSTGQRMAKMPDGTVVEVTSSADEKAKRDAVYKKMRDKAKTSFRVERS